MAEKRNYNAHLNRKGLDASVSEDQARVMAQHQGSHYLFIIDAHAGPKVVAEDGAESVALIIDQVELVPADHEDRVRDLQRAFYLSRPDQFGQAAFEGTADDVDVETAAAGVDAVIQRDTTGEVAGAWDGDPDAPITPAGGQGESCDFPGCFLPAEHDEDHQDSEGTPLAEKTPAAGLSAVPD